jgi:hypothetical protein
MKNGALTETVLRKFGRSGFTEGGHIKVSVLKSLKKSPSKVTRKRATFALNVRKKKPGKRKGD